MVHPEYTRIDYPSVRQLTMDIGVLDRGKHYTRALLEVDVTDALEKIKVARASGQKISFLVWFIKILADAVSRHPPINGIRHGRHQVITFSSVNVATVVEKKVNGTAVPLPLLLRDVNNRSLEDIEREIHSAVSQEVREAENLVLGEGFNPLLMNLALALPRWLRLFFMRVFILDNPRRMHDTMGTVMVTSLGTIGRISGWIIPTSMHPLSIGIGSLTKKAVLHQGTIQKRSILHLTIAIDHDVIDGMPALKFVDDLVSKLELGIGLES